MPKVSKRRGGGERGKVLTYCRQLRREEEGALSLVSPALGILANSGEEKRRLGEVTDKCCISPRG